MTPNFSSAVAFSLLLSFGQSKESKNQKKIDNPHFKPALRGRTCC
jgi:hypothetical protein